MNMFYTSLIVPLFNKLVPISEGSLKEKIETYSKKIGYSLNNIFIIDGSKRSTNGNFSTLTLVQFSPKSLV